MQERARADVFAPAKPDQGGSQQQPRLQSQTFPFQTLDDLGHPALGHPALGVVKSRVTKIVEGLERKGLVQRMP